jgi:hypothetical protein
VDAVTGVIEAGAGSMRFRVAMQKRGMKKIALEAICRMIGLFSIAVRSQAVFAAFTLTRLMMTGGTNGAGQILLRGEICRRSGVWPRIKPIAGSQLYTGCWHRHLAEALTVSSD